MIAREREIERLSGSEGGRESARRKRANGGKGTMKMVTMSMCVLCGHRILSLPIDLLIRFDVTITPLHLIFFLYLATTNVI